MLYFSLEKYSVHSGISLQKGAIIVRYGFSDEMVSIPKKYDRTAWYVTTTWIHRIILYELLAKQNKHQINLK